VHSHLLLKSTPPVSEAHDVEEQIRLTDDAWVALGNPEREVGVKWWKAIYKDQLEVVSTRARAFITAWCNEMAKYWATRTGDTAREVMQAVSTLNSSTTDINQTVWCINWLCSPIQ
jgi:hypothetical protein